MWYTVICSGWKAAQNNNATELHTCMPKARWHLRARDCPAMGSVGYEQVDAAACAARGAWVTNAGGASVETTADMALALLLGVGLQGPRARAINCAS